MPVGDHPTDIAVSPDGRKAYVINSGSNDISVIGSATSTVTATIPVGDGPSDIAVSPDGTNVYVTNWRSNNVSVINAATNTVTATISVGLTPFGVAVTPDGKKVYVVNSAIYSSDYEGNVSVIDTSTNKVTATVNTGKYTMNCPTGVVIGPSISSDMIDQKIKVTSYETDQSTMATLNTTEDIGVKGTNLSSEEKNAVKLNNSNNNSESNNDSSSGGKESNKSNSTPGFGLLGGLVCLYIGQRLRKK